MDTKERQQIKSFLSDFIIINISEAIKERAIEIKKSSHLKLPDSIIAATAMELNIALVTSDRQFKTLTDLNLLYYEK